MAAAIDWPVLVGFAATAFVAESAYGCTSFGPAIIVHIGSEVLIMSGASGVDGSVAGALAVLTVIDFSMAMLQMVLLREELDWRFALLVAPIFSLCVGGGVSALLWVPALDSVWLKMAIGLLLTGMLAIRLGTVVVSALKARRRAAVYLGDAVLAEAMLGSDVDAPSVSTQPLISTNRGREHFACCSGTVLELRSVLDYAVVLSAFSCAGVMGGLVGPAGPPMMLFVLFFQKRIDFAAFRATSAVFRFFGSGTRGVLLMLAGKYAASDWVTYVAIVACSAVGLLVGNFLAKVVPQRAVMLLITAFLANGALLLSTAPFNDESVAVRESVLGALSVASLGALLCVAGMTVKRAIAESKQARSAAGSSVLMVSGTDSLLGRQSLLSRDESPPAESTAPRGEA